MEPNSPVLLAALLLGTGGLLFALVHYRHLAIRITSGLLATTLAITAGMLIVNDYYGYYQSWSQLSTDLSGSYSSTTTLAPNVQRTVDRIGQGRVVSIDMAGARSKINRNGLVYLPPQYFDPRYAHTQFPTIELMHGTPGSPSAWLVHLRIAAIMNELLSKHLVGPMILVMPTMSVGHNYQECVDATGALDDTYVTQDVRADVVARYRVSQLPSEWGVAGYSSGGYCAANLALRHPTEFGASGIMDGYFRAQDGPAARALHYNVAAERANDPIKQAASLGGRGGPIPSFWISIGTANVGDVLSAEAFAAALHGVESVTLYQVPGAGHNFYAWEPAVPYMLQWMWTQLAPPELRVQFPIAGSVRTAKIYLPGNVLATVKKVGGPAAKRTGIGPLPGKPHASP